MKHLYLTGHIQRRLFAFVLSTLALLTFPGIVSAELYSGPEPLSQQLVTGQVTSASDGQGLPGLSILIKGTTIGTVTNQEGRYSI